jgi:hypothetical protein
LSEWPLPTLCRSSVLTALFAPASAIERRCLGRIEPHQQIEVSRRRRQPVGFLVLPRRFGLEIEIKRAVGIEFQRVAIANRMPV